jgi:hypothetical protein
MPRNLKRCKKCGQLTIRISWSQLRTHEECKQKGHLQRSRKRASVEDFRNFFPGTVTDRVVRDWLLEDPKSNLGRMPSMVADIMEREEELIREGRGSIQWKDIEDRQRVLADCIEAVTKIEPALEEYVLPYQYIPDFRFALPMDLPHPDGGFGQIILNGAMDILVKDDQGQFQVWDVKHTKNNDYWRKTEGQLTFYDLAVGAGTGQGTTVTGLLQPLCDLPVKTFVISDDKRNQLRQRVMSMAQDLWNGDVAPRVDNRYCGYCAVKHACPKFAPTITDGKKRMDLL